MQQVNQNSNNHNDRYVSPSSPPPFSPDFVPVATELYIIPSSAAAPYNSYNNHESNKNHDNNIIIQGSLYDNQYEAQPVVNVFKEPTSTNTTSTSTNTPPEQQFSTNIPPPPGCPAGGQWGTINHFGQESGLSFCLCCIFIGIFALPMLLCKLDRKRAYRVNGFVYDKNGVRLGKKEALSFQVD